LSGEEICVQLKKKNIQPIKLPRW